MCSSGFLELENLSSFAAVFGFAAAFFERSCVACFSTSFAFGFAVGAASPLFLAAALALAAARRSAFTFSA